MKKNFTRAGGVAPTGEEVFADADNLIRVYTVMFQRAPG